MLFTFKPTRRTKSTLKRECLKLITDHLWYAVCYINVTYKTQASKGVKPIATHPARDFHWAPLPAKRASSRPPK